LTRLLMLLCAVLASVVTFEVVRPQEAETRPGSGRAAVRLAPPLVAHGAKANDFPGKWMPVVLARPLFAPDRRPAAGVAAADPGMPRLTGIIAAPDAAVAIFQPAGSKRSVLARFGERVGGWEVTAIAADAVNLRKQDQVVVLTPRFDGVQHGTTIAQPQPARPRWEAAAATGLQRDRWSNPQLQP
jgi:hypothetical protein